MPFLAHGVVHQVTRTMFLLVGFWVILSKTSETVHASLPQFYAHLLLLPPWRPPALPPPQGEGHCLSGEDLATKVVDISSSGVHNQPREQDYHVAAPDQREQLWAVDAIIRRVS